MKIHCVLIFGETKLWVFTRRIYPHVSLLIASNEFVAFPSFFHHRNVEYFPFCPPALKDDVWFFVQWLLAAFYQSVSSKFHPEFHSNIRYAIWRQKSWSVLQSFILVSNMKEISKAGGWIFINPKLICLHLFLAGQFQF